MMKTQLPVYPIAEEVFEGAISSMQVTIVGYGRYGNCYIGPKYVDSVGYSVVCVVDPRITRTDFCQSVLGKNSPAIDLFDCFENWYSQYFQKLSTDEKALQVLEVALKPELVYQQVCRYIKAGVKNIILPKPVVTNESDLQALADLIEQYEVKVCVASQWYYAQLPRLIRRELQQRSRLDDLRFPDQSHKIYRAELTISKENGLAYATDPALLELPHALQLLASIGLLDCKTNHPKVTSTPTAVTACYDSEHAPGGIVVKTDVDWRPHQELKQQYPENWDIQNRVLKIYLTANSHTPEIMVDFWIKFDRDGKYAIRPGFIHIIDCQETNTSPIQLQFVEDQLSKMNETIYQAFQQPYEQFQQDRHVLNVRNYLDLGKQILAIQSAWQQSQQPFHAASISAHSCPR